jgi:hypothetical protein
MNDYTKPKSSLDLGDVKKETSTMNPSSSMLEGPLKTKKKSALERFSDDFFSGDAKTIKEYAVKDVLIPSFKRMLSTLVSNAVDILLFGEVKNKSFPDGRSNKYSYTSYSSYYDGGSQIKTRQTRPIIPQREDYRKWVFTESDAKRALMFLRNEIANYDRVSLSKLYQFCGKTWSPADENYGWFDLSTADWHYDIDADGYILELPSPEPII